MNRRLSILLLGLLLVVATACSKKKDPEPEPEPALEGFWTAYNKEITVFNADGSVWSYNSYFPMATTYTFTPTQQMNIDVNGSPYAYYMYNRQDSVLHCFMPSINNPLTLTIKSLTESELVLKQEVGQASSQGYTRNIMRFRR